MENKWIYLIILALITTGCTTYGPLIKPDKKAQTIYLNKHPELSQDVKVNIKNRQIIEGMSKEDVRAIWGNPDKISFENDPFRKYGDWEHREYWDWKGAFFRSFSQDCTITFIKEKVVNIQCDSFWGK